MRKGSEHHLLGKEKEKEMHVSVRFVKRNCLSQPSCLYHGITSLITIAVRL